jgi:hypothetical protein
MLLFSVCAGALTADSTKRQQPVQSQSSTLPDAPSPQVDKKEVVALRDIPIHILKDQAALWTSPLAFARMIWNG